VRTFFIHVERADFGLHSNTMEVFDVVGFVRDQVCSLLVLLKELALAALNRSVASVLQIVALQSLNG